MLTTILQIAGFLAGVVLSLLAVMTGSKDLILLATIAYSIHFVGDWVAGFLKAPLVIGKFDISDAVHPPAFTLFVGLMLSMIAATLVFTGVLHDVGIVIYSFGFALAMTGFVWAVIYP